MFSKKIKFIPYNKHIEKLNARPEPAHKFIPEWFKKCPVTTGINETTKKHCPLQNGQTVNTTIKNCTPFVDALTSGYIFTSPVDIQFRRIKENLIEYTYRGFFQNNNFKFISIHEPNQHIGLPNLNKKINNSKMSGSPL